MSPRVQHAWNDSMNVLLNFLGFDINKATFFHLGRYSLHLVLQKELPMHKHFNLAIVPHCFLPIEAVTKIHYSFVSLVLSNLQFPFCCWDTLAINLEEMSLDYLHFLFPFPMRPVTLSYSNLAKEDLAHPSVLPFFSSLSHTHTLSLFMKLSLNSVTRLGEFWKISATKFTTKVAQIFGKLFGLFGKHFFWSKKLPWPHFGNFWENWAIFYSTIWSHCLCKRKAVLFFASVSAFGTWLEWKEGCCCWCCQVISINRLWSNAVSSTVISF